MEPKGRWYECADAGEKERPSPEEMDVAGEPRCPLTLPVSSELTLAWMVGWCWWWWWRNGLHDSERMEGACDRVTLLCVDRRVGVGDEKESDVEHSDLALLFSAGYFCVYFESTKRKVDRYVTNCLDRISCVPRRSLRLRQRCLPLVFGRPPNANEAFSHCPCLAIRAGGTERWMSSWSSASWTDFSCGKVGSTATFFLLTPPNNEIWFLRKKKKTNNKKESLPSE